MGEFPIEYYREIMEDVYLDDFYGNSVDLDTLSDDLKAELSE